MNWKKSLLICFVILLSGGILTALIFSTEPTAGRTEATKESSMLVDVVKVERGNFTPVISAVGVVEPAKDVILSPRVNGEVTDQSDEFTPGGFVEKGETLLQIDSTDYYNALLQQESELRQARSDLDIELGQQNIAEEEFQQYQDSLTEENEALFLRQPQLNAARAQVESAQAGVQQADLDLQRTQINAPFDAYILTRNVNEGSQVSAGADLGRLVGIEAYWVEAAIPLSKLRWISFPENNGERGSEVRIRDRTAWPEDEYRTGYLYKLLGALEDQTRLAQVLVTVPDPLATEPEHADKQAMMIGSYVEAAIQADELENVVRLNRDYIRSNNKVWVMEQEELSIRDIEIEFQDAEYAYITNGLNDQDQVITTNLATVTEGAPLQLANPDSISETTPENVE